ncbi:hypothetical protein [Azonexus hydrophilus]|uniref:NYN domain-containing protein n=1 Tax=Azonexus hydrophilus TaxID=418702 RepID=A0ABZ2XKS6_9RHOO
MTQDPSNPEFVRRLFPAGFTPNGLFPFQTYRTPRADQKGFLSGGPETAPSVAVFLFSEAFRGVDEAMRRQVLDMSLSEAKKASRSTSSDKWVDHQDKIIRMALWKQFCALPSLPVHLYRKRLSIGSADKLGKAWLGEDGQNRWAAAVVDTTLSFLRRSKIESLLISGDTDIFNPFLLSSKIAPIVQKSPPNQIVIPCRRGVDAMAELWAINNYIPAIHSPIRDTPAHPVKDQALIALAKQSSHAVIFGHPGSRYSRMLAESLKSAGVPFTPFLIDENGRPVPKASPHAASRRS